MADLSAKLKQQIEFYFSDSNFKRDAFMKGKAENDPEGYIAIETLLTFNRLKSISEDASLIAKAVEDSEVVTVSEDKTKIKRTHALTDYENKPRMLYIKGYPVDDEDVNIDSIKDRFSEYGQVLMVTMRKMEVEGKKKFKGSVSFF